MLDLAADYTELILELFQYSLKNVKDYKYYHTAGYVDFDVNKENSTWNGIEMVSLKENKDNYTLNAYFKAQFNRGAKTVNEITTLSYRTDPLLTLSDLADFIDYLFELGMTKINFGVLIGNKAEKLYDRLIHKFNGRIIGTYKNHVINLVNEVCDYKVYELLGEDYYETLRKKDEKMA